MADKRRYLSGSQKRKLKLQQEEATKKLTKLDAFFNKTQQQPVRNTESQETVAVVSASISHTTDTAEQEDSDYSDNVCEIASAPNIPCKQPISSNTDPETVCEECEIVTTATAIPSTSGTSSDQENFCSVTFLSSDLGFFQDKTLNDHDKKAIVSLPPNRPKGPFPKDSKQNNRSFSESYYFSSTKYGPVNRPWLCYSTVLDAAYCDSCWLFSKILSKWRTGVRDWKHLSTRIEEHSKTKSHIEACAIHDLWRKNRVVDKNLEQEVRFQASFWKMVLKRLFKITLLLAKCSLPFRAHQTSQENFSGNFLAQVKFLSEFDDVMKQVTDMPSGSVRYLSPTIQNELIECLSKKLTSELTKQINSAIFFSLLLDTTQDITKRDQLSIVIRTCHIIRDKDDMLPQRLNIKETFLGFFELKNHSATGMTEEVLNILKNLNIPIEKCYGQGYDGASVMSGAYNGVSAQIKRVQPNADYIHCASHNLNLVINDVVSSCKQISQYFTTLQNIYSFFGLSMKRWDLLASFTNESAITLKKLNPTRWSGRISSITSVRLRFVDIIKSLTEIVLTSSKKDEREEASAIIKQMSSFEFVFITTILYKILTQVNFASKVLQRKTTDLNECVRALEQVQQNVSILRSCYEDVKAEAKNLATKWSINTDFMQKRQPKVKRHFDELSNDYRFSNTENIFKVEVFNFVIDRVLRQINNRFESMKSFNNLFDILVPVTALSCDETKIISKCTSICKKYSEIFDLNKLIAQYINLLNIAKYDLRDDLSVKEYFDLVLTKYGVLESDLTEVYLLFLLFFTLPVTTANVERTFSKLKMIKNYLRSTTGQDRLSGLALISIENEEAEKLDLREVINEFANKKARRRDL